MKINGNQSKPLPLDKTSLHCSSLGFSSCFSSCRSLLSYLALQAFISDDMALLSNYGLQATMESWHVVVSTQAAESLTSSLIHPRLPPISHCYADCYSADKTRILSDLTIFTSRTKLRERKHQEHNTHHGYPTNIQDL